MLIFPFSDSIFMGCIGTSSLTNDAMSFQILLKIRTLIFSTIITTQNPNLCIVLSFNHFMKFWNNKFTSSLVFIKHKHVILVQSSIKVTNQREPLKVGTLDGPQTSDCITIKGNGLLFKINENEARWLLVNSQISQRKLEISLLANKLGNNFF